MGTCVKERLHFTSLWRCYLLSRKRALCKDTHPRRMSESFFKIDVNFNCTYFRYFSKKRILSVTCDTEKCLCRGTLFIHWKNVADDTLRIQKPNFRRIPEEFKRCWTLLPKNGTVHTLTKARNKASLEPRVHVCSACCMWGQSMLKVFMDLDFIQKPSYSRYKREFPKPSIIRPRHKRHVFCANLRWAHTWIRKIV